MAIKLSVLGLVFLTGCGTTATITRVNGPTVEAKVVGSDAMNVYVEGPSGFQETIRHEDIKDIDHPGSTAGVLGGIVTAYGALNIGVGLPQCEAQGAAYCTGVFLPLGIGLPIMIWGIATNVTSRSALKQTPVTGQQGSFFVAPTHQFAGRPETPGLSVGGTF
ncbi:hypothetical protein WME99_30045 [Sorangium sp. So ce136]|uniref:hypothetical protein n=1 Tax=Sorangium sp. So ce136 TaxID=3133284 RepID=UPI003F0F33B6